MSRQARSLDVLVAEVDAAAPDRNKASDGGLGDPRHAAGVSDHNVNAAGVWRARDVTNDPPTVDCNVLAQRVGNLLGQHPALGSGAYVIWRSHIISTDRLSEGWRPYSGSNPHDKHVHISVATAAAGYDSTAPWGVMGEPDDMYSDEDRKLARDTAADLAALTKRFDRFADNSWRREAALAKALKEQGVDVDKILAAVEES